MHCQYCIPQNSREFNYDNFGKFKIKQLSSTKTSIRIFRHQLGLQLTPYMNSPRPQHGAQQQMRAVMLTAELTRLNTDLGYFLF